MRRAKKLPVSGQVPEDVWMAFKAIVRKTGASINYCLERVLVDVINEGRIPGIDSLEAQENREHKKFGESLPTLLYDEETEPPRPAAPTTKKPRPASS